MSFIRYLAVLAAVVAGLALPAVAGAQVAGPTAAFSADNTSGPGPLTVNFANESYPAGDTYTYAWDFGDGTTSTDQDPEPRAYTTPGLYTVTLTVTDILGQSDVETKTDYIRVNTPPTARFTWEQDRSSLAIAFTDTSEDPDGSLSSRVWEIDGEPVTDPNGPLTVGTHEVALEVTDNDGESDSETQTVVVEPLPVADFTWTQDPRSLAVAFDGSSTPGAITSWNWDFGATEEDPAHTFATSGPRDVTLTVTDAEGFIGTVTKSVDVNAIPGSNFTWVADPQTREVRFASAATDADGTVDAHAWDFGDGATSSQANPSHTFSTPGPHDVTLTVTDDDGGVAELTRTVTVNARPTASFDASALSGPAPFEPTFTSTAADPDGSIASYAWDFGDGTTGSGATASHRYDAVGTYDVTLTVTDDDGATARSTRTVTVTLPPEVIEESPAAPTLTKVLTDLLERTPGPCSVRILTASALVVCGGNTPSSLNLRTWAVNGAASPVAATVTGIEAVPATRRVRRSAKTRPARYPARRGTIPALGSQSFVLKPPAKLRKALVATLKRRGRVARKPVVTLRAGGLTATTTHLVTARRKKR